MAFFRGMECGLHRGGEEEGIRDGVSRFAYSLRGMFRYSDTCMYLKIPDRDIPRYLHIHTHREI